MGLLVDEYPISAEEEEMWESSKLNFFDEAFDEAEEDLNPIKHINMTIQRERVDKFIGGIGNLLQLINEIKKGTPKEL